MNRIFRRVVGVVFSASILVQSASVFAQTTQHLKKDGTPDMRYKENSTTKALAKPVPTSTTMHVAGQAKADGTAQKPHNANTPSPSSTNTKLTPSPAHTNKDGSPDMRYSTNQPPVTATTTAKPNESTTKVASKNFRSSDAKPSNTNKAPAGNTAPKGNKKTNPGKPNN